MPDGIEGCRKDFFLFWMDPVRRQPGVEVKIPQDSRQVGTNAGQEHGHSVSLRIAQEMFEMLDRDDVRIANPP